LPDAGDRRISGRDAGRHARVGWPWRTCPPWRRRVPGARGAQDITKNGALADGGRLMAKKKRVWLGLAISVACLWLVFRSLDPAALSAALAQANFLYILPAVAVYFVGVWFRSLRWKLLLRPALRGQQAPLRTQRLFRVLVIGFTVNNLLPARLGEVARAYLLWRGERVEPGATIATI